MTTVRESPLAGLGPGGQALTFCPSSASPIASLPEAAFGDLLVVSSTRGPRAVEGLLRDRSVDPSTVSLLHVTGVRPNYAGPLRIVGSNDPTDIQALGMRYLAAIEELEPMEGWVVVDNVTVLLMYAAPDPVVKLLRSLTAQASQTAIRGVFAAVPDALAPRTRERIDPFFDVTTSLDGTMPP